MATLLAAPQAATEFDRAQRAVSSDVLDEVAARWGTLPPNDFDAWFARNVDRLVRLVAAGQAAATADADGYVGDVLDEQGIGTTQEARPNPGRLIGVTSDGRGIDGLLHQAVVDAQQRVARGESAYMAWQTAGRLVHTYVQTELADVGRAATGLGIVSRRNIGYRRMLVPPSCSRCVVLAGRFYRWSAGFKRHPNCNCRHIPCREDVADDVRTDPHRYFESLTAAEQDKTFGVAGAQAIRDGADISQVVNADRGVTVVGGRQQRTNVYGQQLLITSEGTTRRGIAGKIFRARGRNSRRTPRLMPEAIYEIAESHEDALNLLRKNGYLLDEFPTKRRAAQGPHRAEATPTESPAPAAPAAAAEPAAPKARKVSPFAGRSTADLSARLTAKAEAGEIDDEFDALAAEIDLRDQRAQVERDRRAAKRDAKARAQDDKYEQLIGKGVDDETAIEQAYGVAVPEQRRRNARSYLSGLGYDGKGLDEQIRAWHRDEAHQAWLNAEDATNGYMLSKHGERAGIDPRKLWSMPEDRARKYASEELRAWWDEYGRTTTAELKAQLLDPTELARIQSRGRDYLQ
ncbi:hypothetical protein ACFXG4_04940 [Nocardia sp. NPDC059246]|uniref:VG15 protein n=1 Tax=unclassified Nocardia TaxID=2637762 RepID=UPI0036CD4911